MRHRSQAILPIAVDVTDSWSACLLRSCIVLKRQKKSCRCLLKILTWFLFCIGQSCVSPYRVKIWLTSVNNFLPKFAPKWPTSCRFEHRRHSVANCGRMKQWKAYRKPLSLFRLVPSLTPTTSLLQKHQDQLHEACCHLASGEYGRRYRQEWCRQFATLLCPNY